MTKLITDYKIVVDQDLQVLTYRIQEELTIGWQPLGAPFQGMALTGFGLTLNYHQTLVRYEVSGVLNEYQERLENELEEYLNNDNIETPNQEP